MATPTLSVAMDVHIFNNPQRLARLQSYFWIDIPVAVAAVAFLHLFNEASKMFKKKIGRKVKPGCRWQRR